MTTTTLTNAGFAPRPGIRSRLVAATAIAVLALGAGGFVTGRATSARSTRVQTVVKTVSVPMSVECRPGVPC